MSHQDGLGNNGPEATGSSEPDHDDDGMQKKSENVAHAPDGIKRKNQRILGTCGIRLRCVGLCVWRGSPPLRPHLAIHRPGKRCLTRVLLNTPRDILPKLKPCCEVLWKRHAVIRAASKLRKH